MTTDKIKAIAEKHHNLDGDYVCSWTNVEDIENAIREALSSQWVDVKERLPEDGQKVVTYCPSAPDSKCLHSSCVYINDRWFEVSEHGLSDNYDTWDITHWMPIPPKQ